MEISDRIGLMDSVIVAVYLLVVLGIGFWVRKRDDTERGFVRGDCGLPFWAVGLSMMATAVAADDFVGEPQFSFARDCALFGAFAVGYIGVLIVAVFFLPQFYRSGELTIYGFLGSHLGTRVQVAASAMSCIGNVFSAGVGLFIAAIAIAPLLGSGSVPYHELRPWVVTVLLVAGIVGTAYTTIGGIRSVVWTDVLQTVMIFLGGLYAVWFLCDQIPLDWNQMAERWRNAPGANGETVNKLQIFRKSGGMEDPYSPVTLGLWIIFFVGIFGTNHNYTQRLLACRSAKRAGIGMLFGYTFGMLTAVMFLLIGLLLYLFADPNVMGAAHSATFANSEEVYPRLVVDYFPTGLLGLSLAAMLAAVMSSFDSATAAIASSFTADVIRPVGRWLAKRDHQPRTKTNIATPSTGKDDPPPPLLATVCSGSILTASGITAALIYDPQQTLLVDFALGFASFPIGGLLGVFCTVLFTPRGSTRSALAALMIGPIVWLFVQPNLLDMLTQPTLGMSLTLPSLSQHWLGEPILLAWPWWFTIAALSSFGICCLGRASKPA